MPRNLEGKRESAYLTMGILITVPPELSCRLPLQLWLFLLCFSLRCPKRYAQNGARLTPWCIPTASVTVVPVSKSAGDCPVEFVFRDETAVELLAFLLCMFISNVLWVIFHSLSLAPHFHFSPALLFSSVVAWPSLAQLVRDPGSNAREGLASALHAEPP